MNQTDLWTTANPNHLVAAGWIAIPTDTTLDEAEAAKIFAAVGAWNQQKVALQALAIAGAKSTTICSAPA